MCFTAGGSAVAFAILEGIAVYLWYRNHNLDRVYAALFAVVGLIQLVELLIHLGAITSDTGGRLLFLILWLQVVVLNIAAYLYLAASNPTGSLTSVAWVLMLVSIGLFVVMVLYALHTPFSSNIGPNGHLEWRRDGKTILGAAGALYGFGLLLPLLLLEASHDFKDYGIYCVVGVTVLMYFVTHPSQGAAASSLWCYSAILSALTALAVGAIW